jgi:hypothetical protein
MNVEMKYMGKSQGALEQTRECRSVDTLRCKRTSERSSAADELEEELDFQATPATRAAPRTAATTAFVMNMRAVMLLILCLYVGCKGSLSSDDVVGWFLRDNGILLISSTANAKFL